MIKLQQCEFDHHIKAYILCYRTHVSEFKNRYDDICVFLSRLVSLNSTKIKDMWKTEKKNKIKTKTYSF